MPEYVESTRSFKKHELACPCCGIAKIDIIFATRLQAFRDYLDMSIILVSAYRCPDHNAEVPNAAKDSLHTKGLAVDPKVSVVSSTDRYRMLAAAFKFGFTGIGFGKNKMHLDMRTGTPKVWGY